LSSRKRVRYEDVPSIYILRSSQKLGRLASPEVLQELKLGSGALQAKIAGDLGSGAWALFRDLVKLKEKDGLFSMKEGGVELHPRDKGEQEVSCDFLLPAKTPVGEYRVDVFEFEDGKGVLSATGKVKIERSPVISFIISMASNHGLFYGCLAVFIAIIAGLVTGLAFGLGKGGAH
jgi:Putative transmembrane protein (Alph_Pro_TM)